MFCARARSPGSSWVFVVLDYWRADIYLGNDHNSASSGNRKGTVKGPDS